MAIKVKNNYACDELYNYTIMYIRLERTKEKGVCYWRTLEWLVCPGLETEILRIPSTLFLVMLLLGQRESINAYCHNYIFIHMYSVTIIAH